MAAAISFGSGRLHRGMLRLAARKIATTRAAPPPTLRLARERLTAAIDAKVMGGSAAKAVRELYNSLDDAGRSDFFHALAEFDEAPDVASVTKHLKDWDKGFRNHALLRAELEPRYDRIFAQLITLPDGLQLLVDMRAQLLSFKRSHPRTAEFNSISESLRTYFRACFALPLLEFGRVTPTSPPEVLDKLRRYEAVHPMLDDADLGRRVGAAGNGRTVFALFSRAMPGEPLAFVEVAFLKEVATSIQRVLEDPAPSADGASTAIFYSITSPQKGLTGVDLGQVLLKMVLGELLRTMPNLGVFCTLSPMPGFRKWFEGAVASKPGSFGATPGLLELLHKPGWHDREAREDLRPLLMRAAAQYLKREKKGRHALDPVANFHLRNGAALHQINFLADTTPEKGVINSYTMMCNYLYVPESVETNAADYVEHATVATTENLRQLIAKFALK